jgi:hypothetical protein
MRFRIHRYRQQDRVRRTIRQAGDDAGNRRSRCQLSHRVDSPADQDGSTVLPPVGQCNFEIRAEGIPCRLRSFGLVLMLEFHGRTDLCVQDFINFAHAVALLRLIEDHDRQKAFPLAISELIALAFAIQLNFFLRLRAEPSPSLSERRPGFSLGKRHFNPHVPQFVADCTERVFGAPVPIIRIVLSRIREKSGPLLSRSDVLPGLPR